MSEQANATADVRSLAAHFIGFAALGILAVLIPTGQQTTDATLPVVDAKLIIVSVLLAPLIEELIFRWSFRQLFERHWMWTGALAFAVAETINKPLPLKFLSALLLGFAFAYVYKRSGTIATAIAAHAGFNAGILLLIAVVSRYFS